MAGSVLERVRAGGDHAAAALGAPGPLVRERATRPPAGGGWLRPSQVPGLGEPVRLAGSLSAPAGRVQLRPSGALAGGTAVRARLSAGPALDALRGPGQPLAAALREEMGARLGADFSDVRLHTGAAAAAATAQVGARAYTSGSHVVIGDGGADKHTLAHELTHVLQQRTGPVAGTDHGGLRVSDPSDVYERAAEANADRVMSGVIWPGPGPGLPAAGRAPALRLSFM